MTVVRGEGERTIGVSAVWSIISRRWRLLVLLAVGGALVGAALSLAFSPGYVASVRVLLQGQRDPDQLTTEAELAHSSQVLDRVGAALSWDASAAELTDRVTASVATGNIVELFAEADTAERATELADSAAAEYVAFSSQLSNDTSDSAAQVASEQQASLRQQVVATNRRIAQLHAAAGDGDTIDSVGVRTELESLRTTLAQSMSKLDELEASPAAAATAVMGPAERPDGRAAPTLLHFVGGGAGAFVLFGVFGQLVAARADRRPLGEQRVAAALGTHSFGVLAVPAKTVSKAHWARLRTLIVGDRPWYVPEPSVVDTDDVDLRCRRALARLRDRLGGAATRVLIVTREGDEPAQAVARRLVDVAAGVASGPALREVTVRSEAPVLRPTVAAGALVVVGAMTRNAWELVRLHEACVDAGLPVLGVVVADTLTVPGRPTEENAPERPSATTEGAV